MNNPLLNIVAASLLAGMIGNVNASLVKSGNIITDTMGTASSSDDMYWLDLNVVYNNADLANINADPTYNITGASAWNFASADDVMAMINNSLANETYGIDQGNELHSVFTPYYSNSWSYQWFGGTNFSFGGRLDDGTNIVWSYRTGIDGYYGADYPYVSGPSLNTSTITDGYFVNATVIPIPATFWLFSSGLLGLIGIARKKHH
ncbi:MAG: hypothetical protein GXP22_03295 [Gammaproteobacteria bacterium]|nr:hypothetical protein [Gammaproteobacteria bacterium]